MLGFSDDIPDGTAPLFLGFLLLLFAGWSMLDGGAAPGKYHPMITVQGVVTDVYEPRGPLRVVLDTAPGSDRATLLAPGLRGASEALHTLRPGARIMVQYDAFTREIWQLSSEDGGPGFGPREVARWKDEDRVTGHRRALLLALAGAGVLVHAITRMVRGTAPGSRTL